MQGKFKNRSETTLGGELWDLSLQQEIAHNGSEADKKRALSYVDKLLENIRQALLPECKWYKKNTNCRKD